MRICNDQSVISAICKNLFESLMRTSLPELLFDLILDYNLLKYFTVGCVLL